MPVTRRVALTWGTIVGAIVGGVSAYDVRCDRRHDDSTLTAVLRAVTWADTPLGRAGCVAACHLGAYALHRHICKR